MKGEDIQQDTLVELEAEEPICAEAQVKKERFDRSLQKKEGKETDRSQACSDTTNLPAQLYCPVTSKKRFVDPVVASDGKSYERSALEGIPDGLNKDKLYSNRALKTIVEEETDERCEISLLSDILKKTLSQVLEKYVLPSGQYCHSLPQAYYCPITFSLIRDPVIDPDEYTFEQAALESWIETQCTSPITRTPCDVGELYANLVIKDLLEIENSRDDGSVHPSICR
jgi:hypothetical protein